jgi:hypothetical protein
MDLFPDWDDGISLLGSAIHAHEKLKKRSTD